MGWPQPIRDFPAIEPGTLQHHNTKSYKKRCACTSRSSLEGSQLVYTSGLYQSASLEALNTEVDKRSTVVHHTQTSSASRANKIPGSPDIRDQKKTSPTPIHRPKRYALEMWLEVEVGPGLFVPPEDNSYSVDFMMEVINRAYPGCTGMYLDRANHMLAFYG